MPMECGAVPIIEPKPIPTSHQGRNYDLPKPLHCTFHVQKKHASILDSANSQNGAVFTLGGEFMSYYG